MNAIVAVLAGVLAQVPGADGPVSLRAAMIVGAARAGDATLESRLAQIACDRPDLGMPDMPRLPVTRTEPPNELFSPRLAQVAFDEYAALARTVSGEDLARIAPAYRRYAERFARVWIEQASPAISQAYWPEFRAALAACKPPQVNRDHRVLLSFADAALASIPASLSPDDIVLPARGAIARDRAALDLPWFDDACRRARDKWASLSADPSAARAELMGLPCPRFQAEYLEIYAEPPLGPVASRHWSSLILAAMTSIADTSPANVDAAALLRDARAFPVSLTSERTLDPTAVTELSRRAAPLIRTGVSTVLPDAGAPLARGLRTGYPRINDQIARLAGEDAFSDEQRDRWAYQFRAVAAFLDVEQTCEIVLLGPEEQRPVDGATPVTIAAPSFEISVGSGAPAGPFYADRPWDTGLRFGMPGPGLTFRFQATAGGEPAVAELPGPWNVLGLLKHPAARVDEAADPSGRLIKAPLVFSDSRGRSLCYWVGLRFERPAPSLAEWPSDEDWPR